MGLITSYQTAEFGKFVEITGNTQYPAVSVVRLSYPDTSNAFPENAGLTPVSSVDVYSKYAVLTKLINPEDIKISLSAENINVNLDEIELNTDELEGLTKDLNAELSATRIDMNYQFDETQTILSTLTSIQDEKQDIIITLLDTLTSNTNDIEFLIEKSNTKLDILTAVDYATSSNQLQTNTLLDTLTSGSEQIKINTSSSVTLLNELTSSNVRIAGFSIPPYDEIDLEYEGATEYIRKVSYLENTTEVLSLSFVYVTEPPTSSDNRILKVKKL
jgi:hypothetical protein